MISRRRGRWERDEPCGKRWCLRTGRCINVLIVVGYGHPPLGIALELDVVDVDAGANDESVCALSVLSVVDVLRVKGVFVRTQYQEYRIKFKSASPSTVQLDSLEEVAEAHLAVRDTSEGLPKKC